MVLSSLEMFGIYFFALVLCKKRILLSALKDLKAKIYPAEIGK
jgi:hypothetical protein